jgi:AraC family transcriptional activator of pobA
LPAYGLYGDDTKDTGITLALERLHVESIADRSRLHDWEIKPHRHESLFQILYIRQGRAQARMDTENWPLRGPCAVTVPVLVVHGFKFEPDVQGHVITVQEDHLRSLVARDASLWTRFGRPLYLPFQAGETGKAVGHPVGSAVRAVASEYATPAAWRGMAMDALLVQLMAHLARHAGSAPNREAVPGPASTRAIGHLTRYRALIEARFRTQPSVAALAAEMGITGTQLNRVCQAVLGQSALALLHGRLLLEAQRQLAYTTMSVKQVALELGFDDPGYFTRFFQRASGMTPSAWRARSK